MTGPSTVATRVGSPVPSRSSATCRSGRRDGASRRPGHVRSERRRTARAVSRHLVSAKPAHPIKEARASHFPQDLLYSVHINLMTMGQVIRLAEIRRRRARKAKINLLRTRYAASKNKSEKDAIMAKVAIIAPWMTDEQFLMTIKK